MKNSQLKILFLFLLLAAAMPLFGQVVPKGMETVASQILGAFNGPIMITIETICVIGCAIAYAYSKDNEKMKKSMIAIGVSIIVIGVAGSIVDNVLAAAK